MWTMCNNICNYTRVFRGTIHRINVNDNETYYFNIINGNIVDITKEQFDIEGIKIKYRPNELISREKILSNKKY